MFVAGWIVDPDLARTPAHVHVYIGGPDGSGQGYAVYANGSRPDVAAAYPNTGSTHGFSTVLSTGYRNLVPVYIYGVNLGENGGNRNFLMWSGTVIVS